MFFKQPLMQPSCVFAAPRCNHVLSGAAAGARGGACCGRWGAARRWGSPMWSGFWEPSDVEREVREPCTAPPPSAPPCPPPLHPSLALSQRWCSPWADAAWPGPRAAARFMESRGSTMVQQVFPLLFSLQTPDFQSRQGSPYSQLHRCMQGF